MNEVLDQILKKHGINEEFKNAKQMDKENRIFISNSYVVKIYYLKKYHYYYNELDVYQNLKDKDYIAKLHYYGEEENYKYIIISRLDGKLLFESWDNYNKNEKIDIVKQIGQILKDINSIHTEKTNFIELLDKKFYTAFEGIEYPVEYKNELLNKYLDYKKYIDEVEKSNLIHVDVHFYNFFVNKGRVYAYDFENMLMGPTDYQLLRWYRMWKYPETFIYPKNSLSSEQIKSYSIIMPTMLECYPELCLNNNFDERIKLYLLVYLIEEAKRCKLSEDKVKQYIKNNENEKIRGLV